MTTADTYARTAVAAPGYPTDLTPADAELTEDGKLASWRAAFSAALNVTGPPVLREADPATAWTALACALRRYVAERGEDPTNLETVVAASNQIIRVAEGRVGDLD